MNRPIQGYPSTGRETASNSQKFEKDPVSARFPFRPLNGYLMITDDPGGADPARGTVISVCQTLKGQIFPGDFVMYPRGARTIPLSFGKARGCLINVTDLYGFWDAEELHRIERETQGRPGVPGRAVTFDLETKEGS